MIYLVLMLLGFQIPLSIQLGMSEAALNQIYPGLKTTKYHSETNYHRPETIEGVAVEWVYRFENDKLNWVFLHHYSDELNKENFELCLKMAKNLIEEHSKIYGKPILKEGNQNFVDPYKDKHHWGYYVLEAEWKMENGVKLEIQFDFMGAKGVYMFLVQVELTAE